MPLGLGTYFGSTGSSGGALDTDARTYCDNALIFGQTPIQYDNAASFNGTSQSLSRVSNSTLQSGAGDFTFCAWINPSSWATKNPIVGKGASGGAYEYQFYHTTGNITFLVSDGSGISFASVARPALNTWTFVVGSYNATTKLCSVSLNAGTAAVSGTPLSGTVIQSTGDFNIGRDFPSGPAYFAGQISHVGFWKRSLTSTEISRLYNGGLGLPYDSFDSALKTLLVSYWRLNDNTAADSQGTNTLTNNGSVTFNTLGPVATLYDNARSLINSFVIGIKGLNLWANMVCWPLRASQNTSSLLTANSLGGLTSAQATLVNLGVANTAWGSQGIVGISTTSRLTTAYTLPSTSASILAAWQNLTSSQFNPIAATAVATSRLVLRSSNATSSALDAYNGTTNDQFGIVTVPASINFSAASFNSSTSALVFQTNALPPTTGTNTGSLALTNLIMGAYGNSSGQGYGLYSFAAALNTPLTTAQITSFRQLWGSTIGQGLGITS